MSNSKPTTAAPAAPPQTFDSRTTTLRAQLHATLEDLALLARAVWAQGGDENTDAQTVAVLVSLGKALAQLDELRSHRSDSSSHAFESEVGHV